jgi:hypothetical protein
MSDTTDPEQEPAGHRQECEGAPGSPHAIGHQSAAFEGIVGIAVPASRVAKRDYLIDPSRYPSEGNWAFCRFESDEVPAIRLGFELGGFNPGPIDRTPKATYLQLHLAVMTREGALFWLPSGEYSTEDVVSDPDRMDVRLETGGREIFRLHGWPDIASHFRSDDGDLEVNPQFDLTSVSVLPDAPLSRCVFDVGVDGICLRRGKIPGPRRHSAPDVHLHDAGSQGRGGLFGYYALDVLGRPIEGYRFCVYVDAAGNSRLLSDGVLAGLDLDDDDIARSWHVTWRGPTLVLGADVTVQPGPIIRSWGANAPQTRRDFGFPALFLDAAVQIQEA